jgi:hypothetical protein
MQIGCLPLICLLLTDNTMYNVLVAEQLMICYVFVCPTWISNVICGVLFICLMIWGERRVLLKLVLLWQLFYLFCFSIVINTVIVTAGTFEPRFGALKSDSTHHFFRNACTKSGSLRFSQFSGCWLIFSVYILMSFDFPVGRLFGVR